jgi:hypothetical protein
MPVELMNAIGGANATSSSPDKSWYQYILVDRRFSVLGWEANAPQQINEPRIGAQAGEPRIIFQFEQIP